MVLLLLACSWDCDDIGDPRAREDCRFAKVANALEDPAAFDAALGAITDPDARDLVLLRLAVQHPERAGELCGRVQTDVAREKCQQVLGRPHLRGAP